jgi:hypothetical protein
MKKYVSFLTAIAAVMLLALPAFADTMTRLNENSDIKTIIIYNSGAPQVYNINATASNANSATNPSIVPGMHRILGYSVTPITSGAGVCGAALFDSVTLTNGTLTNNQTNILASGMFSEKLGANTATLSQVFSYPKKLTNGLSVQTDAGTITEVDYEVYQY